MENYYIGTISEYFLTNRFFEKILLLNGISLKNAFIEGIKIKIKDQSECIAFLANDKNYKITLDSIGKCYVLKFSRNMTDPFSILNTAGDPKYKVYILENGCEKDGKIIDESCPILKNSTKRALGDYIDIYEKNLEKMKTRQLSITDNIDDAVASTKIVQESNNQGSSQESNNELISQYQELLNNIRHSHKNSKQLLSDKNRLIASTSSNIQTSTDKLEDLNNKINEANQEIAKNNSDFDKKNNIITTLRAMITIFFILLLIMIVYYGALYTRDAYPETYNSISNTINNSFSSFSSFNTNY
jgi:hypothetical protein